MILITGATGHLGSAIIDNLLKTVPANQIVALVRDEAKASALKEKGVTLRVGHYNDAASIQQAVQGVDSVLLVSGVDANRLQQHITVIDAAIQAGVKHIAYTSLSYRDFDQSVMGDFIKVHPKTEDYIKDSGINYTIFRNSMYTDILPGFAGERVLETGIFLPTGDGKTSCALRSEMAEGIANSLLLDSNEKKTYNLTGPAAYSFAEIAETLSDLSGKTVSYTSPDMETFIQQLKKYGVPEKSIFIAGGFSGDIKNNQFEEVYPDLENLLGRRPTALAAALKTIYDL
ncbi:Quinone oxidoreductase 2 [compost metagenome]